MYVDWGGGGFKSGCTQKRLSAVAKAVEREFRVVGGQFGGGRMRLAGLTVTPEVTIEISTDRLNAPAFGQFQLSVLRVRHHPKGRRGGGGYGYLRSSASQWGPRRRGLQKVRCGPAT